MLQPTRQNSSITTALLKINGLTLLLPQDEICSLELVTDIDATAPALHSAGWITYANKHWPVYCLTQDLTLMTDVPTQRRACAMLAMGAGYIGILCDDMTILKDLTVQPHALPPAMQLPGTPILHLALIEQGIACATNANHLTSYVGQLVSNT